MSKKVAVIGASANPNKYGHKAVKAYLKRGYTVYPINHKEKEILGLKVYQSIKDVPDRLDIVSVYLPPQITLKLLPDIAAKGCDELWLNPGAESEEVLAKAKELGLNVIQACNIINVGYHPDDL
ncbi:MAG TPA: CoA-binding protein [Verrucomicrobiota bacterium]|nr:CoA-binding protein [Verrucomicrobiota bacterium]